VASDPAVDRYIVRDVDSRLNARDRIAVEDWIHSSYPAHILRDHVNHCIPMNGERGEVKGIRGGWMWRGCVRTKSDHLLFVWIRRDVGRHERRIATPQRSDPRLEEQVCMLGCWRIDEGRGRGRGSLPRVWVTVTMYPAAFASLLLRSLFVTCYQG